MGQITATRRLHPGWIQPPPGADMFETVDVTAGGQHFLTDGVDYKIVGQTITSPFVRLRGGRHLFIAEFDRMITEADGWGAGETNLGFEIRDELDPQDRIIHIEGGRLRGKTMTQGFILNCGTAEVQMVNVRVQDPDEPLRYKNADQRDGTNGLSANHPDIIQAWSGFGGRTYGWRKLHIDGFTAYSGYQGIFPKQEADAAIGPVYLRRSDLHPTDFVGDDEEDGAGPFTYHGGAMIWKHATFPATSYIWFGSHVYCSTNPNSLIQGGNYVGKTREYNSRWSFDTAGNVQSWSAADTETISQSSEQWFEEGGSLKIVDTGAGGSLTIGAVSSNMARDWSGSETLFHAYVYVPVGAPGSAHTAQIRIRASDGTWFESSATALTLGEWNHLTWDVSGVADAGVANLSSFIQMGVQVNADSVSGDLTAYVDNIGNYQTHANPGGGVFADNFQPPSTVTTGTEGGRQYAEYPDDNVTGRVWEWSSDVGEFVPANAVGPGYDRSTFPAAI